MINKLKKVFPIIILLGLFNSVNASHVKWLSNFDEAHKEALKQNKHLMESLANSNPTSS